MDGAAIIYLHGWSTWMATEIVILVGDKVGGAITGMNGDTVVYVDHNVIDNMDGPHT